jgi:hypothetical protein
MTDDDRDIHAVLTSLRTPDEYMEVFRAVTAQGTASAEELRGLLGGLDDYNDAYWRLFELAVGDQVEDQVEAVATVPAKAVRRPRRRR